MILAENVYLTASEKIMEIILAIVTLIQKHTVMEESVFHAPVRVIFS